MTIPCKNCITFAVCRSYVKNFNGSDIIYGIGNLSTSCSILGKFIDSLRCTELSNELLELYQGKYNE